MMPISSILLARLKAASDMHYDHHHNQQHDLHQHDQYQANSQPQSSSLVASFANSTARDYYERYMSALAHNHSQNQNQNLSNIPQLGLPSTSNTTITSKACSYDQTIGCSRGSLEFSETGRGPVGTNDNILERTSLVHRGHRNLSHNHNHNSQHHQQRQQQPSVQSTLPRAHLSFPCQLIGQHSKRKRRHRTIFSEEQLAQLESVFCHTQYPDVTLREHLATHINLKEARIEVWFKNRRAKLRKQQRDSQHPAIALGPDAASLLSQRFFSESGMMFQNFDPIYAMPTTISSTNSSSNYSYSNQQLEQKNGSPELTSDEKSQASDGRPSES